jgi:hypothetical protein
VCSRGWGVCRRHPAIRIGCASVAHFCVPLLISKLSKRVADAKRASQPPFNVCNKTSFTTSSGIVLLEKGGVDGQARPPHIADRS